MFSVLLLSKCGVRPDIAASIANGLSDTASQFGIISAQQQAAFIAECMHESMGFTKMEENMDYSALRLSQVWPKRFSTIMEANEHAKATARGPNADALRLAHNPEGLANFVYAGRNGNGSVASGDGWRYRGSGYIQSTGLANFMAAKKITGTDYVARPELARTEPRHAAIMAGCYWYLNGLNSLITSAGIDAVSHKINPYDAPDATARRRALYTRCYAALA